MVYERSHGRGSLHTPEPLSTQPDTRVPPHMGGKKPEILARIPDSECASIVQNSTLNPLSDGNPPHARPSTQQRQFTERRDSPLQVKMLAFINAVFTAILFFLFTLTGSLSDLSGFEMCKTPPSRPKPFFKQLCSRLFVVASS